MDLVSFLAGLSVGVAATVAGFGLLVFAAVKANHKAKAAHQERQHRFVANMAGKVIPEDEVKR